MKKQEWKPVVKYHPDQHAWMVKDAVGMSGVLLMKANIVKPIVEIGSKVDVNTPIAKYRKGELFLSPVKGTVTDVNMKLKDRPIQGSDWIVRIK